MTASAPAHEGARPAGPRAPYRRRAGVAVAVLPMLLAVASASAFAAGVRVRVVDSDSMAPGLPTGSRLLTVPADADQLEHGDVVIVRTSAGWREAWERTSPGTTAPELVVKRVIGLPGDAVECCAADGALLLDGEPLDEPYLLTPPGEANSATFRTEVGDGQVWLMGDNRRASFDSRAVADVGSHAVDAEDVIARVVRSW